MRKLNWKGGGRRSEENEKEEFKIQERMGKERKYREKNR